ncbi:dnaJ homolog subfamily C member 22-like [Ruditapes philippinarum]|uniref:dnaJ homolog subfamily C member 22-like n=1 Tax=Ruditapes philippinarum TaxID=129788 RepID=UPI00295A6A26|nr:dnaJ homolog subfamily C member 22-like [Ruditapes philippinarum]
MANIIVAYICWVLGGPLGLHHFYLGRDKQALVWWMSLGGLFLGWIRDLWRLPEYLYEANKDQRVRAIFQARRAKHPQPPWKLARFAGQMLIGTMMSYLFRLAIPEFVLDNMEYGLDQMFKVILPVIGAATGVSLVSNIGVQKVSFKWCILGAAISTPWLLLESPSVICAPLFSSLMANYKREWDIEKETPTGVCNFIKRVIVLALCGCIYMTLWGSVICFNMHVTTSDGMQVPIYEAIGHFFESPAWKDFKKTMNDLYEFCQVNGWDTCYQQLVEHLDPTGEAHAYKVLGFDGVTAHPDEIQPRCRKLSRQYHPDKFNTAAEKLAAQEKFIEIQKACDILSNMRKRRAEKNMKSDSTKTPHTDHRRTEF